MENYYGLWKFFVPLISSRTEEIVSSASFSFVFFLKKGVFWTIGFSVNNVFFSKRGWGEGGGGVCQPLPKRQTLSIYLRSIPALPSLEEQFVWNSVLGPCKVPSIKMMVRFGWMRNLQTIATTLLSANRFFCEEHFGGIVLWLLLKQAGSGFDLKGDWEPSPWSLGKFYDHALNG